MSKLEPCPFCRAAISGSTNIERFAGKLYIRCGRCGIITRTYHTEAELIKIWNTRR